MSERTKPAARSLTPYESEQVRPDRPLEVHSSQPFRSSLFKSITTSITDLVEKVIPDQLVIAAIEKGYRDRPS